MGKLEVLFPGQGSQEVGMGKQLAENNKEVANAFATSLLFSANCLPIPTSCEPWPGKRTSSFPISHPPLIGVAPSPLLLN
ncbi:UNVERIFIED_CONTAM: hypothetical protein ACS92_02365 [Bacillus cereus]